LNKPDPEQRKADCLDKLNDMVAKVESGEVTEVLVFGLSNNSSDSENLDIYTNVSMSRGHQRDILIDHLFKRIFWGGKNQ